MVNRPPLYYLPRNIATQCTTMYFVALILCSVLFTNQALPLWIMTIGGISVIIFFMGSAQMTKKYAFISEKAFEKKIFGTALIIRLIYVVFTYFFNEAHYGHYYESDAGDIPTYINFAEMAVETLKQRGNVFLLLRNLGFEFSDTGYIMYLTTLNLLTGSISPIFLPMLLKAVWGSITCISMYQLARRHFGEEAGRMTAIFCVFQANMIWWCGSLMKETEMLFLSGVFINRADKWLQEGKMDAINISIAIAAAIALCTFRAALGAVAFASLGISVVLTDKRVISAGKKVVAMSILIIGFFLTSGVSIYQDVQGMYDEAMSQDKKEARQEQRAREITGNKLMVYATSAVLAPMIFTIPFPSMVYTTEGQEMMMMVNGGNYEKNLFSFFVIIVMFMFLFNGEWRRHVFPIAYLCGYLVALVFSEFAHSGRFHMPAIPLELMFAAYGISLLPNNPKWGRWFKGVLFIELVACIGWCYIKLVGRGLT